NNEELLMDLGKAYLSFFMSHPNYFVFLFGKSNVNLDLTEDADPQKNYKPFVIFKSVIEKILFEKNRPREKWNDTTIALWAFIHGITSIATMKGIKYGQKWEDKLFDFMQTFQF
nr:WHG domain-containing protein [Treponema sp.]